MWQAAPHSLQVRSALPLSPCPQVVQEVTKQLSARFIPDPTDIKKHLENLIEREFIERDRNDRRLFVYLA